MIPETVKRVLEENGLAAIEFQPGSTPTAELAASKLGVPVAQIAKSLLFVTKAGDFHMIVCPGDHKISNKRLRETVGGKARMASASEMYESTGFRPGEVCPFGVTGIPIHLDVALKAFKLVYPAAGTDSSGVPVTFEHLKAITGANECACSDPPD